MKKPTTVIVVPTPGRRVLMPESGRSLPSGGAEVDWSPFWARRLRDGDVTEQRQPRPQTNKPARKE